jgi:hypothetical protein
MPASGRREAWRSSNAPARKVAGRRANVLGTGGATLRAPVGGTTLWSVRAASTGLVIAATCAALAGCGGSDDAAETENPNDEALNCIRDKDLPVRKVSNDVLQVGPARSGPRIVFFRTVSEAEAKDFAAEAPGAEQVGRALLYVNRAPDGVLTDVEFCLEELVGIKR